MSSFSPSDTPSLKNYLALWLIPGIGPQKFNVLLETFPDPNAIFTASSTRLEKCGLSEANIAAIQKPDWAAVDKHLDWAQKSGHFILSIQDENYPPLLREIAAAPPLLFGQGNPQALLAPQIAIVGSRNATAGGNATAEEFAHALASTGLTITSGLALGIDAASHSGALRAQCPTVAVMGTGLDQIYPARNRKLADAIIERGALISEYPLGTRPEAKNFPRRNRIISGLSQGVLVVEATLGSGSLITAHCALEQGREIFAIPGSIHNPLSRGCHALIRQGAKLVEKVQDILEELNVEFIIEKIEKTTTIKKNSASDLDKDYARLMKAIDQTPVSVDTLVSRTGLTVAAVSSMLLILELQGKVFSTATGYIKNR